MRAIASLLAALWLAGTVFGGEALAQYRRDNGDAGSRPAGQKQEITLGVIGLSFYEVTGEVVRRVLEDLGHEVRVVKGPHSKMYPRLANGEIDLLAASWLPNTHGNYWKQYGNRALTVSYLYSGARLFWGVPGYVPASAVGSVADLADPDVAGRMNKTITTLPEDTGLTIKSRKLMEAYGLGQRGYTLEATGAGEWIAAIETAIANEEWVAIPLWTPQWLNVAYDIRPLADPRGLLGSADHAALTAHIGFPNRVPPETLRVLKHIELSREAVSRMDLLVNREGMSPGEAAAAWLGEHRDVVAGWKAKAESMAE